MESQAALSANWLQWPAMIITVASTWLIASKSEGYRKIGFVGALVGNGIWTLWGVGAGAIAVIILQILLAFTNIRGVVKADESQ
jgi:presenilin-like A22 family membrane protease